MRNSTEVFLERISYLEAKVLSLNAVATRKSPSSSYSRSPEQMIS